VRGVAIQLAVLVAVALLIAVLASNVVANLQRLGVQTGFGFLERPAGFDISQTLIGYSEQSTYLAAFEVALLNTLLVTSLAGALATLLGFVVGLARLSSNGLVASAAGLYVETFRNIPLLILLLFWYFAVLRPMPGPRESLSLGGLIFLNNRGLFMPVPQFAEAATAVIAAATAGLALAVVITAAARRARIRTATKPRYRWLATVALFGLPAAAWVVTRPEMSWSIPRVQGFNFTGGVAVTPELFALTLGLSMYSAAYIAEIVRSGVQAVPRGQIDAARALGLSRWQIARLIEIPLALRIIVPPLGAYYVILLKDTSLGSAIAYPDLMHVFAGTVLNQTGQPLEVMLITLATYLALGFALSGATGLLNWRLRR
jgi:general L-amino acid transport system permease protein